MSHDLTTTYPMLDSGVDYITATVKREEQRHSAVVANWFDILREARQESGLVEDAGLMGYVGLLSGAVFVGHRWDGSIIRITGGAADQYFTLWAQATGKPTRIDLQITLRCGQEWRHVLHEVAHQAELANEKLPPKRQRKLKVVNDNDQGHTYYIGARTSKTFGRVYHKWAKDRDRYEYGDLRFEVEVHGDEAVLLYEAMSTSDVSWFSYTMGYVVDWFARRGVRVPCESVDEVDSKFTDVLEANPLTDKLSWLYNQVGPTARLLSDQGHTASVLRVLFGPQWLEYLLGRLTEEGGTDDATQGERD